LYPLDFVHISGTDIILLLKMFSERARIKIMKVGWLIHKRSRRCDSQDMDEFSMVVLVEEIVSIKSKGTRIYAQIWGYDPNIYFLSFINFTLLSSPY